MRAAALLLGMLVLGSGPAAAAGFRDLQDGWLLPAGRVRAWLDPASTARQAGWWLAAGNGRLFGLPELPQRRLAGGAAVPGLRGRVTGSIAAESLGDDLVCEDQTEYRLTLAAGPRVSLLWTQTRLVIGGRSESEYSGLSLQLGSDWRAAGGLWWLDLTLNPDGGPDWYGPSGRRPFLRGTTIREASRLALSLALDRRGDGGFCGGIELDLAFGRTLILGLRSDPPTGAIGPVTCWRAGMLLVRTSHLAHPELGTTHRAELVVGFPGRAEP